MNAEIKAYVRVSAEGVLAAGKLTPWADPPASHGLPRLHAKLFSDEPFARFGRMDPLSKVAMVAAGLVLRDFRGDCTEVAQVGGTALGCVAVDDTFEETRLAGAPSPAQFVYTLPSMFQGEIAIRHGLRGRCTLLSAGRLSGLCALATGVRWVLKDRAGHVLVVAADATPEASAAAAWLLAPGEGPGFKAANLHGNTGETLGPGNLPNGLYGISELENATGPVYATHDGMTVSLDCS
jgi:3-oxoacyl-(acyl-carrier-protein) synthase